MVDIVIAAAGISDDERWEAYELGRAVLFEHISRAVNRPKQVVVTLDNGEWKIELEMLRPSIVRTRRITGYLSNLNNFNAGKKAEERERAKHFIVN